MNISFLFMQNTGNDITFVDSLHNPSRLQCLDLLSGTHTMGNYSSFARLAYSDMGQDAWRYI